MKVVIDIPEEYAESFETEKCKNEFDALATNDFGYVLRKAFEHGTPLKTCGTCGLNYGIMTNTEFNPNDIVCEYWSSDGLESNDYCSRWKSKDEVEKE